MTRVGSPASPPASTSGRNGTATAATRSPKKRRTARKSEEALEAAFAFALLPTEVSPWRASLRSLAESRGLEAKSLPLLHRVARCAAARCARSAGARRVLVEMVEAGVGLCRVRALAACAAAGVAPRFWNGDPDATWTDARDASEFVRRAARHAPAVARGGARGAASLAAFAEETSSARVEARDAKIFLEAGDALFAAPCASAERGRAALFRLGERGRARPRPSKVSRSGRPSLCPRAARGRRPTPTSRIPAGTCALPLERVLAARATHYAVADVKASLPAAVPAAAALLAPFTASFGRELSYALELAPPRAAAPPRADARERLLVVADGAWTVRAAPPAAALRLDLADGPPRGASAVRVDLSAIDDALSTLPGGEEVVLGQGDVAYRPRRGTPLGETSGPRASRRPKRRRASLGAPRRYVPAGWYCVARSGESAAALFVAAFAVHPDKADDADDDDAAAATSPDRASGS